VLLTATEKQKGHLLAMTMARRIQKDLMKEEGRGFRLFLVEDLDLMTLLTLSKKKKNCFRGFASRLKKTRTGKWILIRQC
jgi:hypothetical protein